jgi:hypothetical protein
LFLNSSSCNALCGAFVSFIVSIYILAIFSLTHSINSTIHHHYMSPKNKNKNSAIIPVSSYRILHHLIRNTAKRKEDSRPCCMSSHPSLSISSDSYPTNIFFSPSGRPTGSPSKPTCLPTYRALPYLANTTPTPNLLLLLLLSGRKKTFHSSLFSLLFVISVNCATLVDLDHR